MLALGRNETRLKSTCDSNPAQSSEPKCNLDTQLQAALANQNNGGAEEDRTPDPLLAKQVLSQLSYSPILLSDRFEAEWWAWVDSNYRPHPYQGCALTN